MQNLKFKIQPFSVTAFTIMLKLAISYTNMHDFASKISEFLQKWNSETLVATRWEETTPSRTHFLALILHNQSYYSSSRNDASYYLCTTFAV